MSRLVPLIKSVKCPQTVMPISIEICYDCKHHSHEGKTGVLCNFESG